MASIKELFDGLGIKTRRNEGSDKVVCPKCSATRKKKNEPCLSIDLDGGFYNCHNPGCDFRGCVRVTDYEPRTKEYIRPVFVNNTELSDGMLKWFMGRAISPATLNKAGVTQSVQYMPQVGKEVGVICFNYFREGELINVKYRDSRKNFKMVKGAELVFYGLDDIKGYDWCVIVEGEIDKLSFLEAGVTNVVSVPNGASKGSMNLEYLDNCIEHFDGMSRIILATDNDEPGIALREELARRLGYERCFKAVWDTFKDANEVLCQKGPKSLTELLNASSTVPFPLAGIITVDDVWEQVEEYLRNGLPRGDTSGVLPEFDRLVSVMPGMLSVITGIPNHGKSPFCLQWMVGLSLKHGYKWAVCTPEHNPLAVFIVTMCELLLGHRMRQGSSPNPREMELAREFIREHFFFIQPEDSMTVDSILDKARSLVIRYGVRGMIIDPWNKLEHSFDKGENETMYVSRVLDKIIRFDQRHGIFTMLVVHPTKMQKIHKSDLFEVPNLYSISGSSNWYNKVDIGISFYRNYQTKFNEIHVQKMKYNHLGEQGLAQVRYNVNNSRFGSLSEDYDNSNWLLPKATQTQVNFYESRREQEALVPVQDDAPAPF